MCIPDSNVIVKRMRENSKKNKEGKFIVEYYKI